MLRSGKPRRSGPDIHKLRTTEGLPYWGRAGCTGIARWPSLISTLWRIVLPTLPVFQGAAISSECFSRYILPGNVAELRASPPPSGVSRAASSFRLLPILRFRDTELAALSTPEASLERLVPLVDVRGNLLPNVSRWVLQTVEKGYYITVSALRRRISNVFSHIRGPEYGSQIWFLSSMASTWEIPVRRDLLSQAEGMISTHFLMVWWGSGLRYDLVSLLGTSLWFLEALCRTPFEPIEEISALLLL